MKKKLIIVFGIAALLRFVLAFVVWHPDVNNHIDWGIRFYQYGPSKFFAPESNVWSYTWPNQPPGTIYIYAGIRKLFEFIFNIFWIINVKIPAFPSGIMTFFEDNLYPAMLKLPSILADLGIGWLIFKIVKKLANEKKAMTATMLWLFNPVVWYNSAIWGQTDGLINFFALLAFYLLSEKKYFWSVLVLVISFYIKVSLLIFLPVYAIVFLKHKVHLGRVSGYALVSLGVIGLLTLPFSVSEPFSWLFELYRVKVLGQQLHVITANAFNIWATLTGIHEQPNTLLLGPLTYGVWGMGLFLLSYVPVIKLLIKKPDLLAIVWSLAIVSFSSWMLMTNMHERYLFPLFVYLPVLVGLGLVNVVGYLIICLISLLNLYNYWWFPRIEPVVTFMSFSDRLMPRVFGLINFGLYLQLYSSFLRQIKHKTI